MDQPLPMPSAPFTSTMGTTGMKYFGSIGKPSSSRYSSKALSSSGNSSLRFGKQTKEEKEQTMVKSRRNMTLDLLVDPPFFRSSWLSLYILSLSCPSYLLIHSALCSSLFLFPLISWSVLCRSVLLSPLPVAVRFLTVSQDSAG